MAVVKTPEELEQEQQQQNQQNQTLTTGGESAFSGSPAQTSGAASSSSGSAPAPSSNGAPSNGFTNMDKYLQVNEGANQALTNQIVDKASKSFDEAGTALDSAKSSANTAVASGTTKADAALTNQVATNASKLSAAQTAQAAKVNAGYAGPGAFEDTQGYKAFSSLYDTAYQDANQYKDPTFRSAMLDEQFNNSENKAKVGGYSSGMRGFDSALLNNQAGVIGNAVDQAGSKVTANRDSYQTEVNAAIKAQKADADAQKKLLTDSVSKGRNTLLGNNEIELFNKNAERNKALQNAGKSVTSKIVDEGKAYSMGDVLSNEELAIAKVLDGLDGKKSFTDTSKTYKDFTTQALPAAQQPVKANTTPTVSKAVNGSLAIPLPVDVPLTPEQQIQRQAEIAANEKKKAADAAKPIINPGTIAINPNLLKYI